MEIVHLASEVAPIAKVGGLGDVLYGLSLALCRKGHRVTVMLPKYDCADLTPVEELEMLEKSLSIKENGQTIPTRLWTGRLGDLRLILIDPAHPSGYFKRGTIYAEPDDNDRFLFFCTVCITYLKEHRPDVIHLHDWPAAGAALIAKGMAPLIFTIHNLHYQGRCASFNLDKLGITFEARDLIDPEQGETLNLMRGALTHSHCITTVSPTYREQILTKEYGCGLEDDLRARKKKLKGILNGIDTDYWNPSTDLHLFERYNVETQRAGKTHNKHRLLETLGLKPSGKPLVTSITRLVPQKGPDLILYGIGKTLELGGQFILLGSTPDQELLKQFAPYRGHPDVICILTYDESLAHKLYAASDMLLMPSIFEPCGLAQLIAMRYGTLPLVHKTGGLADTVKDGETGFCFEVPDNRGVARVLQRALKAYTTDNWPRLIRRAMLQDYSWETSAQQYVPLYGD